ncbi:MULTISPECIES: sodium/glutamate symporter [Halomonas]|uniref:sodium/glutamate symporter n=1 Tax=Halomonas TaxID=2745 RepID=UPI001A90A2C0|nr:MULTISPECIES: sodium/glutamate symporter [Halomonas]MED5295528.1 sodium/glutamate symporter [Pseudomonadota bacterium]MBN8414427.1 sodium/glutamate symporter [Halomonas litopenaei]MBY5927401.1 sodium/glutamate symporter [Halomonas sp. DP4Y7-2]MBY5929223.1 sodium/glutamate symporter [Halomonas sp. DP8Y7-3]MBY5984331.1 sodium/glutamate symporter [Halomonas sp. DP5Y7-2]
MHITLDAVATTALALLLLATGAGLKRRLNWLEHFCVPTPVIGGFGFALLAWLLRDMGIVTFELDTAMQSPLMIAFFTTVGLGGSLALLKKGGKALGVYLVACWLLALMQNGVGIGMASLLGLDPLIGLMAGATSLEGGFGAAAAFGPEAEALGAQGAATAAIVSATFGMIVGGVIGAPIARWIIDRRQLPLVSEDVHDLERLAEAERPTQGQLDGRVLLNVLAVVVPVMVLGVWFKGLLSSQLGIILPSYVGAMFVAILLRNLNDRFQWISLPDNALSSVGDVALGIFLTMAMMNLKIWQLQEMGGPLLLILLVQTLAIVMLAIFVLFRLLGRNYDAAVLTAGFIGHGLGATPNAVANMSAVCDHYRVISHKAFIIVPLCGAVLIDIVAIPAITWCLNAFA